MVMMVIVRRGGRKAGVGDERRGVGCELWLDWAKVSGPQRYLAQSVV